MFQNVSSYSHVQVANRAFECFEGRASPGIEYYWAKSRAIERTCGSIIRCLRWTIYFIELYVADAICQLYSMSVLYYT